MENDIVLLKLEREIPFKKGFIQPAPLPEINFQPSNETACFVSGWGRSLNYRHKYQSESGVLRWAKVSVIEKCERIHYGSWGTVICARDGNTGTCYGDSGGPLVCLDEDNSFVITGVVSGVGYPCVERSIPSTYTIVTRHLDWIKANMEKDVTAGEKHCSLPKWMMNTDIAREEKNCSLPTWMIESNQDEFKFLDFIKDPYQSDQFKAFALKIHYPSFL